MRQKLEGLLELQNIEIEIKRLDGVLNAVPEKLAALDAKQEFLQETYDNEKENMAVLKKKYRDMESDVQTNTARISKSHEKLTAVKTNKEYQALLKEIDDIKEKNSSIEDEMIVCLEQMEISEADLSKKGENLKQMKMQIKAEIDTIDREAVEDTKRLESARKLSQELADSIDATLKADYERVKSIVKTRAVVPVLNAVCQGCHLNIPPQMFNELQRGDQLKFCPHCDRIIFWNDTLDQQ